jgi:hypothetical protein
MSFSDEQDVVMQNLDSDAEDPCRLQTRPSYPASDRKLRVFLEDQHLVDDMAQSLQSTQVSIQELKMDGFVVELRVADGFSLGNALRGADTNLKWSTVFQNVNAYFSDLLHV